MQYDGSIRIDTRIDERGLNQGVASIKKILAPIARIVATAFLATAVVAFGRTAVQAASETASAMVGLQSVAEGVGISFSDAHEFIKEFTSDGLVPATNAVNSYKNLLLRGYDTSQIERVLTALKDSAAFGRQGRLSMGEAIQSATEGLKNENSILVDNAGVTKNVSMMWRDYAASIGTTVGALTQQQKIQAEVNGILQETRFQTGDAAKLASTYAGQVSALGVSFYNLKVGIGNVIIPIAQRVMPYIKAAIDMLTVFANRLASIMSILFGVDIGAARQSMDGVADASNAAADGQANLAKQTKAAGKEARGALAAFDELNVLQQPDESSGSPGLGVGGLPELGGQAPLNTKVIDEQLEALRAKVEGWKQSFLQFIAPVKEAWDRLWISAQPLIQTVGNILLWLWNNVLVPLGTWVVQKLLPVVLDLVGELSILADNILTALGPAWEWLWKEVLQPAFAWIGSTLISGIEFLTQVLRDLDEWTEKNEKAWQLIVTVLGIVAVVILALTSPIAAVVLAIIAIIAIIANWGRIWEWLKGVGKSVLDSLKAAWATLGAWFQRTVIDPISKGFTTFLNNLSVGWQRTWDGIKGFVKNTINTIIDLINSMIRAVAGGINAVIGSLNSVKVDIPSWVPVLGGQSWALNIPTVAAPQIPRLARGAVIPPNAEFLAVLGDQRNGRNLEAPEGLIRQIIQEEMGNISVDVTIGANPNIAALWRMLKPYAEREEVRRGGTLIAGGGQA
ncbi:MAG: hypothetical protein KF698_08270 [Anaerolineales bacterium]|nr:hypothetical protein [Anaerolineales bacterium]